MPKNPWFVQSLVDIINSYAVDGVQFVFTSKRMSQHLILPMVMHLRNFINQNYLSKLCNKT